MSNVICTKRALVSCLFRIVVCSLLLSFCLSASALEGLNWAFQPVGYSVSGGTGPQTAVAMRDGKVWPVVFAESQAKLQAYTLYPVTNPVTKTNWFQIGSNLIQDPGNLAMLSAATSSDGRFGAVLRSIANANSSAIVGASPSGFGPVLSGVQAIDFDKDGNLIKGTLNTIPVVNQVIAGPLLDIAASPTGDLGAIDANFRYYQKLAMAGVWGYTDLKAVLPTVQTIEPNSLDLTIDSLGRPHIVGLAMQSTPSVVALDFNIATGSWVSQTLGDNMISAPFGATAACDGRGRVGAAWVERTDSTNLGTLMYAYKDGTSDWVVETVATGVPTVGTETTPLTAAQGVGLTFDSENLPVISFTSYDGKIWLAYDPISPIGVPEPSTLALLGAGVIFGLVTVRRWRR